MKIYEKIKTKINRIFTKSDEAQEKENGEKNRKRKKKEEGKLAKLKKHIWTVMFLLVALAVFVGSTVAFGSDSEDVDECRDSPCSENATCINTGSW